MEKDSKIYVAGHKGMVGSAILRKLEKEGYSNIIMRTSTELDLRNQALVTSFFETEKPEYVFLAAAIAGGIQYNNTQRATIIYDNLVIQSNVIHHSYLNAVKKLLFLSSSCVYPRDCPQPIKEEYLLTGELEQTNEPYAVAKISGMKTCESYYRQYGCKFLSVMPTNLYGPNDKYDLERSHVLPALIRRFHEAKVSNSGEVILWGTGTPKREFLHSDDVADACIFLMNNYDEEQTVNIGAGEDLTINDLALMIKEIVGYDGKLSYDPSKPDGTPRKLLDVSKLTKIGWTYNIGLREGITRVYEEVKDTF